MEGSADNLNNPTDNSTNWLPYSTYDSSSIGGMMVSSCSQNIVNGPEDIFIEDKEGQSFIIEITSLKECVSDILHKKSEFEDSEYDDCDYKDEEIDNFVKDIKGYTEKFEVLQKEIYEIDKQLKDEIKSINENIDRLNTIVEFLSKMKLDDDIKDNKMIQDMVENIKKVSSSISKTDKFNKIKKEYVKKRKELNKYIYLLREVNTMNVTCSCPICFSSQVDTFLDPCGHTLCKQCIINSASMGNNDPDIQDINSIRNMNTQCPICRKNVQMTRPLFFL